MIFRDVVILLSPTLFIPFVHDEPSGSGVEAIKSIPCGKPHGTRAVCEQPYYAIVGKAGWGGIRKESLELAGCVLKPVEPSAFSSGPNSTRGIFRNRDKIDAFSRPWKVIGAVFSGLSINVN